MLHTEESCLIKFDRVASSTTHVLKEHLSLIDRLVCLVYITDNI